MCTAVFCFVSNTSEIWRSYFLAIGLFTGTYMIIYIGMLSVISSGVYNISASIITLYCCLSSHFPEYLYNFLIFYRHICSYRELLLNNWSNMLVTICCFSSSELNNPFSMKHFCKNYSIEIILSIILVNALDLVHCNSQAFLPSV